MKYLGKLLIWVVFILVIFNMVTGVYYYLSIKDKKIADILSPLPDFLSKTFNTSALASDLWIPKIPNKTFEKYPLLSAKAAISYDLSTNKLLYAENIDTPLPIASLTKIMTAIIVLENMNLDDEFRVSKKAAEIGENSMGLSVGEVLKVEDLLYGLLLPSGNDAATVLAENSPVGSEGFKFLMNKKAEELGLSSTRFTNTTGLEGDGSQFSTVKELLILTRYALKNPVFAKIVSTYEYDIVATDLHKEYVLYNETNLLTSYPGVKGVKTGYTEEAGMCLVTYLEHNGHNIIGVLLNSQNRRFEMKELLDYSLRSIGETPPKHD